MRTLRRRMIADESVIHAKLDDEAVLLKADTGVYFGLNAAAADVWDLLVQGAAEEDVFDQLLAQYEVEPNQLRSDIADLIDLLTDKELIRVVDM